MRYALCAMLWLSRIVSYTPHSEFRTKKGQLFCGRRLFFWNLSNVKGWSHSFLFTRERSLLIFRGSQVLPRGRYRIRCRDSSTTTTAPCSNASVASASTVAKRLIRWGVRVLCKRSKTTLAFSPWERAMISPKSRSNVTMTRFSEMALKKISPFGIRCKPSSRKCIASCPFAFTTEQLLYPHPYP